MTTQDVEVVREVPLSTGHLIPAGQTGLMEISEARWNFSWVHDGGMLSIQGDNTSLERSKDNESFWCNAKLGNGQVIQLVAQQDANTSQSVESVKVEPPVQTEGRVNEEAMAEPPSLLGSAERLNLVARAAELRQQGILTDEEFQIEKRRILGSSKQPINSINTGAESVGHSTPVSTTALTAPPISTDSVPAMNRDTTPLPVEKATPIPAWLAAKEIVSPSKSSPSRPNQDDLATASPESNTHASATSVSGQQRPRTVSPSSTHNPTSTLASSQTLTTLATTQPNRKSKSPTKRFFISLMVGLVLFFLVYSFTEGNKPPAKLSPAAARIEAKSNWNYWKSTFNADDSTFTHDLNFMRASIAQGNVLNAYSAFLSLSDEGISNDNNSPSTVINHDIDVLSADLTRMSNIGENATSGGSNAGLAAAIEASDNANIKLGNDYYAINARYDGK